MNLPTKLFLLFLCCFASCVNSGEDYVRKLKSVLSISEDEFNSLERIYILTENGCPRCNQSFAWHIEKVLDEKNYIFISNASGYRIDMSFISKASMELKKVYPDEPFFDSSKVILLSKGKIDTILKVNPEDVRSTLVMLSSKKR